MKKLDSYDETTATIHCTNGGLIKLNPTEQRVFDVLRKTSSPLDRHVLAERLGKSVNTISVTLSSLANKLTGCSAYIKRVGGGELTVAGKVDLIDGHDAHRCPHCNGILI